VIPTGSPTLDASVAEPVIRNGLTSADAHARLVRDGPNDLPPPPHRPSWRRFADQLVHFFALMLWVAGALAFVAGLPQLGVAIVAVAVVKPSSHSPRRRGPTRRLPG
jgi:hypothetical protein